MSKNLSIWSVSISLSRFARSRSHMRHLRSLSGNDIRSRKGTISMGDGKISTHTHPEFLDLHARLMDRSGFSSSCGEISSRFYKIKNTVLFDELLTRIDVYGSSSANAGTISDRLQWSGSCHDIFWSGGKNSAIIQNISICVRKKIRILLVLSSRRHDRYLKKRISHQKISSFSDRMARSEKSYENIFQIRKGSISEISMISHDPGDISSSTAPSEIRSRSIWSDDFWQRKSKESGWMRHIHLHTRTWSRKYRKPSKSDIFSESSERWFRRSHDTITMRSPAVCDFSIRMWKVWRWSGWRGGDSDLLK